MNYKLLVIAGLLPLAVLLSFSAWDVAEGMRAASTPGEAAPVPGQLAAADDPKQPQEVATFLVSLQTAIAKKEEVKTPPASPENVAAVGKVWQECLQAQELLVNYSKVELQLRGNAQPELEQLVKVRDELKALTFPDNLALPDQERISQLIDSRIEQLAVIIKSKEAERERLARLQRAKDLFARGLIFERKSIYKIDAGYSSTDDVAFRGCIDELEFYLRELEQLKLPKPQEVVDLKRSAEFHESAEATYRKYEAKDHQLNKGAQEAKSSTRIAAIRTADPEAEIELFRKFVENDYASPPRPSDLELHKLMRGSLESLKFWQRMRKILLAPPTEPNAWVKGLQSLQSDFPNAAKAREQHLRFITTNWVRDQLSRKELAGDPLQETKNRIEKKYMQLIKSKGSAITEAYFSTSGPPFKYWDTEQEAKDNENTHRGYFHKGETTNPTPMIPVPVEHINSYNGQVADLKSNMYDKSAWSEKAASWAKMQSEILDYQTNGGSIAVGPDRSKVSLAAEAKFAKQMVEQWEELSNYLQP